MSGRDRDEGSVVPLIAVCLAIAVSLIAVAAAATTLHLERMRLLAVADGAALAGAEAFDVDDATVEGDLVVPHLRAARVRTAVEQYLAGAPTDDLPGFALVGADAPDGASARVRLRATWRPPILSDLLPVSLPVTVDSTAAARFR